MVEPAGAERIHAGLVGEKRFVWIDGSDHLLTLDVDSARAQVLGEAAGARRRLTAARRSAWATSKSRRDTRPRPRAEGRPSHRR